MSIVKGDGIEFPESDMELREFMGDESFVHYVGMISPPRPGVGELLEFVEHEYYKPGTARNDLFLMRIIRWEDVVWTLVSIPIGERSYVEKAVRSFGLRIVDGVPTMLSGGRANVFRSRTNGHSRSRTFPVIPCIGTIRSKKSGIDRMSKACEYRGPYFFLGGLRE